MGHGSCFAKLIPTLQKEGHELIASQHGLDSHVGDVTNQGYVAQGQTGDVRALRIQYHHTVQRLFSMFPAGSPGLALLLLRFVIIGILLISTVPVEPPGTLNLYSASVLGLISVLLLLGAFTPIACAISIVFEATHAPTWEGLRSLDVVLRMLVIAVLLLLGPGAYSLDSRMFGRRLILPPSE